MHVFDKKQSQIHSNIRDLTELSRSDTLYHDLYRQRACIFMEKVLPKSRYHLLRQNQTQLESLPIRIRNAMMHNDWSQVRELSARHTVLQLELKEKAEEMELAGHLYETQEIPVNPFSPGMYRLSGVTLEELEPLKKRLIGILERLAKTDTQWQVLYHQRNETLKKLPIYENTLAQSSETPKEVLEEEALDALEQNNITQLEKLAEKILQASINGKTTTPTEMFNSRLNTPADYRYQYPKKTLKAAAQLGLNLFHAPSRHTEFAPFARFAWHPTYSDSHNSQHSVLQVPDIPLPEGVPQALKNRLQLFAIHPFINSGGVRYLPNMLEEDVLVEDFPEPKSGTDAPSSELIEALGLKRRNCLTRYQIESALLQRGNDILEQELDLEPGQFKLVCIPPDLHLRIGQDKGWGKQQIWTHFDGYMLMSDSSRRALAGGDVRYGGIYDLLGLSCNYDAEQIIVRFAVVQRRRMEL